MNTASSGSGRVDDIKGHPPGEIRGQTKLIKTDMRRELARQPFEEKIRKVGQLIKLSATVKSSRRSRREAQMTQHPSRTRAHIAEASLEIKL